MRFMRTRAEMMPAPRVQSIRLLSENSAEYRAALVCAGAHSTAFAAIRLMSPDPDRKLNRMSWR